MPKLSIVIPAVAAQGPLDDTLVSVLENRPADCEVIVVCREGYRDPYGLEDEICFAPLLAAENDSGNEDGPNWATYLNAGLRRAEAPIVHALMPGMLATPDWTTSAVDSLLMADPSVWAAAPLIIDIRHERRIWGVSMSAGGMRKLWRHNNRLRLHGFGPTYGAGFFHRERMQALGGWCQTMHPGLADLEIALRASQSGTECMLAVSSFVLESQVTNFESQSAYLFSQDLGRLYRRYLAPAGAMVRPFALFSDVVRAVSDLTFAARAAGHVAGILGQPYEPPTGIAASAVNDQVKDHSRAA